MSMTENESINGWTFEETVKTAENLIKTESNMFKWDVLRHLRDFAENYKDELEQYRAIGTIEEFKALKEKEERFDRNIKMFNEIGLEIRNKAIDEFYNKVLNFEDYIEPLDTSEFGAVLLYSGKDITDMIVKITEEMRGSETDG